MSTQQTEYGSITDSASDEAARLAALARYEILDTPAEPEYDDLVQLAARVCGTPIALMTLLDDTRQWFKSRVGLAIEQTPREVAFCDHAIRESALLEIQDAWADPRFSQNPLVTGEPRIRFYAGVPLRTPDGHALGSLCVIDRQARTLQADQRVALAILARQVVGQLELRHALRKAQQEVTRRHEAEASLQTLNRSLEERVEARTRALHALSARLQSIREDERTRISREIHDDLGQRLTALKMDLKLLGQDLASVPLAHDSSIPADLDAISGLVDTTLKSVRRIAQELRPDVLDALGLVPGIEWLLQDMQSRSGLNGEVVTDGPMPQLNDAQTTAVFRIVQEAVTNVVRHADASRVDIRVSAQPTALDISIHDDGRGFLIDDNSDLSLGVLGMRERAAAINATLVLNSQPGQGTRVHLSLKPGPDSDTSRD